MPDPLDFDDAKRYAQSLTTIPECPRFDAAIEALASDLIEWCTGAVTRDQVWQPKDQAAWLVTEARQRWKTWTGSVELHDLFRAKFPRKEKAFVPATEEDLIRRGLLCGRCFGSGEISIGGGAGMYCACSVGLSLKKWESNPALATKPTQKVQPIRRPLDPKMQQLVAEEERLKRERIEKRVQTLIGNGERIYSDEQRRKLEQLDALGIDIPGQVRNAS